MVFAAAKNPNSIEGTYRLVSRDLADGTQQTPPQLQGLDHVYGGVPKLQHLLDGRRREKNVHLLYRDLLSDR